MTKLFVGNLPYTTTSDELNKMFSEFGAISDAVVISDKFSGRSKGFGFVEMDSDADAQAAIDKLNGSDMGGRNLVVSVARPREERPDRGGDRGGHGGGGGRGGYRN